MTFKTTVKAGALAAALAIGGTAAMAESADYSDAKLDAFVTAALDVSQMNAELQRDLQAAETPEEQQQIATEAQAEAKSRIEAADGITVEEYAAIGQELQTDQELAARVSAMVEDRVEQQ
ncbi:DUF4168 domain-containing protein [Marinibacterium profundimaris]|uniref:DUF4168 domain-containing protein n=1 Tax=Marinibacterium profundimaris TaxID=1679460 RepID=A0A225NN76_9RHOB|nr:DUF4168 domain-containing protein [Marinibacterium profundimaris]OWU72510.1 hypothetical protein ATO3_15640 [Marinibacterium profundimaris]